MTTCRTLAIAAVVVFLRLPAGLAQGTREDYLRAQQFLPGNLRHRVYVADVIPHWIAEKNRFWYRKAGTKGTEFILVDAEQNASGPAFDHARLAASLSKAAKREYQPTELPFDTVDYAKDGRSISLQVDGMPWTCQLENYECKREPEPVAGQYEEASPRVRVLSCTHSFRAGRSTASRQLEARSTFRPWRNRRYRTEARLAGIHASQPLKETPPSGRDRMPGPTRFVRHQRV